MADNLNLKKVESYGNSITEKYRWKLRTQLIGSATCYTWRENRELEERLEENIQKEMCIKCNNGKIRKETRQRGYGEKV